MGLPLTQRLGFSIGHVLNDLTASVWFSYLIVYFHQVMNFNNNLAGYLMLIGQVSDALFTPFIGYESDRSRGFCGLGRRKSWHLIGTYTAIKGLCRTAELQLCGHEKLGCGEQRFIQFCSSKSIYNLMDWFSNIIKIFNNVRSILRWIKYCW